MDEKLIVRAGEALRKLQEKQKKDYPLLREAAAIQTEIEQELERTKKRVKVRVDWVMVKNLKTNRTDSLPYALAEKMVKAGKGVIVKEFGPLYENHWVVDKEPPVLADLRRVHLGDPVVIYGQCSEFFREINRRIGFDCPLITAAAYQINRLEHTEDNDEKTREVETTGEREKGAITPAKEKRASAR